MLLAVLETKKKNENSDKFGENQRAAYMQGKLPSGVYFQRVLALMFSFQQPRAYSLKKKPC